MKFLLPLLGLLLLSGTRAQKDVDVEGLREIVLKLLNNGEALTSESLSSVAMSFSGVEKDSLNKFITLLKDAKEPEELYIQEATSDLITFRDLLYGLKALGVNFEPKLTEVLLGVLKDQSLRVLRPIVDQWKRVGTVTLGDEPKKSIDATINAINEVIKGTEGSVRQRLKKKIESEPTGMARSTLFGIDQDLEKIAKQQGGSFSFSADEAHVLPKDTIKIGSEQVNKVFNREIVLYVSQCMKTMTRAQVKLQVEILLRKVYDNPELPAVLQAVLQAL